MTPDRVRLAAVVAPFLGCAPEAVEDATPIGITTIEGSIRYHRMFAAIETVTGPLGDRRAYATFGDLLEPGNGAAAARVAPPPVRAGTGSLSVGIDIELVDAMPKCADYREDAFYRRTFSPREIGYCLMAADVAASFAGRFAAKEAILKADARYAGIPFSEIEIEAGADGKPRFAGFALSISHAGGFAIAVAVATDVP